MSQTKTNFYEDLLARADALIKAGRMHEVAPLFAKLNFARIPRKWRQALAKTCRRSGLVFEGLRMLHPVIRDSREREAPPARAGEICEYAVLLSRIGAIPEALALLATANTREAPEGLLYQGFCHVSGWNYEASLPCFEEFIAKTQDPYMKLITRVNLAAAYVHCGKLETAAAFLDETLEIARASNATRLYGNCLELKSQVLIENGELGSARQNLEEALRIFERSQAVDRLLVQKWMAVIEARESGSLESLVAFRDEAIRRRGWEDQRESDFLLLQFRFDEAVFNRLLFGTPNEAYRNRVLRKFARLPQSSFLWGEEPGPTLALDDVSDSHDQAAGKIRQALVTLSKDFYAPVTVGALFSDLYPGEYFDVESSVLRIRQVLRRTRRWLEDNGFDWNIRHEKTGYRLQIAGGRLRLPFRRPEPGPFSEEWLRVSSAYPTGPFTTAQACRDTGLSRSGFHRLAKWAIETGRLEKMGAGKNATYALLFRIAG